MIFFGEGSRRNLLIGEDIAVNTFRERALFSVVVGGHPVLDE
jgi:hypothetical protein